MEEDKNYFEVESIIDVRYGEKNRRYYQVRWKGCSPEQDTWEPQENLKRCKTLVKAFHSDRRKRKRKKREKLAEIERERQENSSQLAHNEEERKSPSEETRETNGLQDGLMRKQVQVKKRRVVDKNRDLMSPVSELSDEMDCSSHSPSSYAPLFETQKKDSNDLKFYHKICLKALLVAKNLHEIQRKVGNTKEVKRKFVNLPGDILSQISASQTRRQKQEMEKALEVSLKEAVGITPRNEARRSMSVESPNKQCNAEFDFESNKNRKPSEILDDILSPTKASKKVNDRSKDSSTTPQKDSQKSPAVTPNQDKDYIPLFAQLQKVDMENTGFPEEITTPSKESVDGNLFGCEKSPKLAKTISTTVASKDGTVRKPPPNKDKLFRNLQEIARQLKGSNVVEPSNTSSTIATSTAVTQKISTVPISTSVSTSTRALSTGSENALVNKVATTQLTDAASSSSITSVTTNRALSSVLSRIQLPQKNSEQNQSPKGKTVKTKEYETTPSQEKSNENAIKRIEKLNTHSTTSITTKSNNPAIRDIPTFKTAIESDTTKSSAEVLTSKISSTITSKCTPILTAKGSPPATVTNKSHTTLVTGAAKNLSVTTSDKSSLLQGPAQSRANTKDVGGTFQNMSPSEIAKKKLKNSELSIKERINLAMRPFKPSEQVTSQPVQKVPLNRSISAGAQKMSRSEKLAQDMKSGKQPQRLNDKSKRLSLKEYQAKKRKRLSTDTTADQSFGISFMKTSEISQQDGNNPDNMKLIIPKPSVEDTGTPDKMPAKPTERLPKGAIQESSTEDVLGNILNELDGTKGNDSMERKKALGKNSTTEKTAAEVAEHSAPSETEEEDILLEQPEDAMREEEEEYEEGSDNETDLDEYTPDEEDYFYDTHMRERTMSHLLLPNANTKKLQNYIVHQAILRGDKEMLIQCDIDSNTINEYVDEENTLLMKAVMEKSEELVKILLEKRADPNVCSKNGKSPLMVAAEMNKKSLVILLIKNKAHLNIQTKNGETALLLACKHGFMEIVHVLLNSGADVKPALSCFEKIRLQFPNHLQEILFMALQIHSNKLFQKSKKSRTIFSFRNLVSTLLKWRPQGDQQKAQTEILKQIIYYQDLCVSFLSTERLKDFTESVLRTLMVTSCKMELKESLMHCRCISPSETSDHNFFFQCDINPSAPGSNVLMLALPVLFERSGKFTADFTLKDNGINDVLLNEESMMTIAPGSSYLYYLSPIYGVNHLKIITNANRNEYKILICVYNTFFGGASAASRSSTSQQTVVHHNHVSSLAHSSTYATKVR